MEKQQCIESLSEEFTGNEKFRHNIFYHYTITSENSTFLKVSIFYNFHIYARMAVKSEAGRGIRITIAITITEFPDEF